MTQEGTYSLGDHCTQCRWGTMILDPLYGVLACTHCRYPLPVPADWVHGA